MMLMVSVVGVGMAAHDADRADAFGYSKTLTGSTAPRTIVCAYNVYRQERCVWSNGYGQYSVVVPSGYYYYVAAYKQFGCVWKYNSTAWFFIGDNARNPTIVQYGVLYPDKYWSQAC